MKKNILVRIASVVLSAAVIFSSVNMPVLAEAGDDDIFVEYLDPTGISFKDGYIIDEEHANATYVIENPTGDYADGDVGAWGNVSNEIIGDYIYSEMLKGSTEINISSYNVNIGPVNNATEIEATRKAASSFLYGMLNEHTDLYYVGYGTYSYSDIGGYRYIKSFKVTYDTTSYDIAAFDLAVEKALSVIEPGMTDVQKAIALHDYIVLNCAYDMEHYKAGTLSQYPKVYTAYGVLVDGSAVCQGYAEAYKYLLEKVGIKALMVSSDSMNHAWNLIELDGKWYQVDATWDDPTWDKIGYCGHSYMFLSDAAISDSTHNHEGWIVTYYGEDVTSSYKATSTTYDNAFWTGVNSQLVYYGGYYYYIKYNTRAEINKISASSIADNHTNLLSGYATWRVWDKAGYTWPLCSPFITIIGDRIYYNTPSEFKSMKLDGTDIKTEATVNTSTGYVYFALYRNGKIYYSLDQSPNISYKQTIYELTGIDFPADAPVITLKEANLSLGYDKICFNIYMDVPEELLNSSSEAYIDISDGNRYYLSDLTKDSTGTVIFKSYFAPKDYDVITTLKIVAEDGSIIELNNSSGVAFGDNVYTYSCKNYLDKALASELNSESATRLNALYYYCMTAKNYFKGTSDEYSGTVPAAVDNFSEWIESDYDTATGLDIQNEYDGMTYVGSSLILEDTYAIRHYFAIEGENLSFCVDDKNRKSYEMQHIDNTNLYYVELDDIYYGSSNSSGAGDVSIIINGSYTFSMKYDVNAYIYNAYDKYNGTSEKEALVELVKALYAFNRVL